MQGKCQDESAQPRDQLKPEKEKKRILSTADVQPNFVA